MPDFCQGCLVCEIEKKTNMEKCFKCSEAKAVEYQGIYSLGFYFPRFRKEHHSSKWSQAIMAVKRNCVPVVSSVGRILAFYLLNMLELRPFILTSVPDYSASDESLFNDAGDTSGFVMQAVARNFSDARWIWTGRLLVQEQEKIVEQHLCRTDAQRTRNIRNIYAVSNPDMVKGRNIVLLDDVVTSGATLQECARVLHEAGAKDVLGLAIARTMRKETNHGKDVSDGKALSLKRCE